MPTGALRNCSAIGKAARGEAERPSLRPLVDDERVLRGSVPPQSRGVLAGLRNARDVAAATREAADQLLWVQAEALQQVGVPVAVDLLRQLLVGLVGLVGLAALAEHVDDLCLVELHWPPFWCPERGNSLHFRRRAAARR